MLKKPTPKEKILKKLKKLKKSPRTKRACLGGKKRKWGEQVDKAGNGLMGLI